MRVMVRLLAAGLVVLAAGLSMASGRGVPATIVAAQPTEMPITHLLVIFQGNRSFDRFAGPLMDLFNFSHPEMRVLLLEPQTGLSSRPRRP